MTNKLEIIRATCIEANPEIKRRVTTEYGYQHEDKIRLADVLLAMRSNSSNKQVGWEDYEDMFGWNLREDNLKAQNEQTIDFIYNLLT